MKPKDALRKFNASVNEGERIKFAEGQGRLSRAAVEKCTELSRQGWSIDGYVVASTSTVAPGQPVEVKKVAANGEKTIADLPTMRYDERAFKAVSLSDGKEYGMREVCRTCGNSLTYHYCDRPMPLGVPVRIVQR